jgi:ABC-2 type transport system permease protein
MSPAIVAAIMGRELRGYFFSPLAWIILSLFLLVQGYSFYLLMLLLAQPDAPHGSPLQLFFGGTLLYWLFVIITISALTMRLLAEERRRGTLESVLTAPVNELELTLGKYLAALLFYAFLWLPTSLYIVMLSRLAGAQSITWGPVAAGYLGTMLVGAACLAVGLWASALTRSQIIAALLTFTLLSLLLLLSPLGLYARQPTLKVILDYLNLFDHLDDFARGIVDSRRVVFYLSLIVFFLCLSVKTLEAKKWR